MLARMSVATSWSLLWEGVQASALATCNQCDIFMSLAVEEVSAFITHGSSVFNTPPNRSANGCVR